MGMRMWPGQLELAPQAKHVPGLVLGLVMKLGFWIGVYRCGLV